MVPTRSTRSSSRQSSILKPPKPRQPLQHLNFNSSSNENSPATTTKIKRRVSFAEKKHVKEFCNSLEQGTVWDNTYEEHDLSHQKASSTSNQEECDNEHVYKENILFNELQSELICITSELVETCSTQETNLHFVSDETRDQDVNTEECSMNFTNVADSTETSGVLTEESKSVSISSVKNDGHVSKSIIVYEDPVENAPDKVSEYSPSNVNTFNCNEMNTTSVQDIHMEFTEVVCNTVYPSTSYIENNLEHTLKSTSMELTQAVPMSINILQQKENVENLNLHYRPMNSNITGRKEIENDMSMDLTVAIPSVIKPIDDAGSAVYSANNRSEKFDDISMEITAAVKTITPTLQHFNNQVDDYDSDSVLCENDKRSIIFHDASMEITKAVKTNIHKDLTYRIQEATEYRHDMSTDEKTRLIDVSMEMTKAIPVNIYSMIKNQEINVDNDFENLRYTINSDKASENCDKTKICNDESMEFTTAISTLPKIHLGTLNNSLSTENASCTQLNPYNLILNNCESDNANLMSDRTRIFHNHSMTTTAVVSSLKTKHNYEEEMMVCEPNLNNQQIGRTMLFPNTSMEITEAIMGSQCQPLTDNPITDYAEVRQSIFSQNFEKKNLERLDDSAVPDNILSDITDIVVPSSLNSDTSSNKENSSECLESNTTKETVINTIEKSVNSPARTIAFIALHESEEQVASPSALKESNMETACAPSNSASNGTSSAITLELNQNMCLQHEQSRDVMLNPRRTYTVQRLSIDRTVTVTNNENSQISLINNDIVSRETYDQENRAQSNIDIFCNADNSQEKNAIFFSDSIEELESIKPPSFVCLDDSSSEDVAMDITCNQDANADVVKFKCNYQDNDFQQDDQIKVLECMRKSQTFLIKGTSLDGELGNTNIECEVQVQSNGVEILSHVNSTNMETPVLECSSSTINDSERFSVADTEKDSQDANAQGLCTDNSNKEDMDCSLPNTSNIFRDIPQSNMENKCPRYDHMKLNVDQTLLNETDAETEKADKNLSNLEENHRLEPEGSLVAKEISMKLDPFSALMNKLKVCAQSDNIIWNVYHENMERKMFSIGFISCSLLAVIFLTNDYDDVSGQFVKEIKLISRLADDADVLVSIVHRIILEKLDTKRLMDLYKTAEDIPPLLDHVSKEVKLAMDFMFELKRLNDLNLMEIALDRVSFVLRTKRLEIILKITVNIKPLDRIEPQDISVQCLLGSVRDDGIKKLITNIKRDHKFLRRYMNDVRDYIYLMEESGSTTKRY